MRLMACFGVVVLLVILDSLSKALATAEETKRSQWLQEPGTQYNIGGPPLDRDLRSGPGSPKAFGRIPRTNVQSFGRIPRTNIQSFGRIPRTNMQSFGRIPRTNVQSFGRIPRTNLQSFGRIPRTEGDTVEDASNSFDREIRWHPRRAPKIPKIRPPRGFDSPKPSGRIPRAAFNSFGRIPRTNVQSFGRIPRTFTDSVDDENLAFEREARWHSRPKPFSKGLRPPRKRDNKAEDKFLEEMSRRAWGARLAPGTAIGKRDWEKEDNFAFKRTDENQALLDAMLDVFDARNTYNNNED